MPKSKRRNPDHVRKHQYPGLDNEVIAADLEALLTPALYAQQTYIRQLGLRNRILNLSLMWLCCKNFLRTEQLIQLAGIMQ